MNQIEILIAVQKMQDYIDLHLQEPITLKQLANEAGYSVWHAARLFKEATEKTPFEYIRAMRLTKAALKLRDEEHRVLDIALNFVFDSQEGFTRAFSRQFGLPPRQYRKNAPPIPLFLPYKAYDTYRQLHKGGRNEMSNSKEFAAIFVQVIERPARKVILKRGVNATEYFQYCEEVGCDVWGVLTSVKEALYEPIGMWLPKKLIKEGTSLYVQGVEVPLDYNKEIPEDFEIVELEPCKMMIFQGEPYDDDNFEDEIVKVWEKIEKYDPSTYGYAWDPDVAPRFQLAPMGYRGYIEARPVKEIK